MSLSPPAPFDMIENPTSKENFCLIITLRIILGLLVILENHDTKWLLAAPFVAATDNFISSIKYDLSGETKMDTL